MYRLLNNPYIICGYKITMKGTWIKCKGTINGKPCNNEYPSRKDLNAEKKHDRPQCGVCGERA